MTAVTKDTENTTVARASSHARHPLQYEYAGDLSSHKKGVTAEAALGHCGASLICNDIIKVVRMTTGAVDVGTYCDEGIDHRSIAVSITVERYTNPSNFKLENHLHLLEFYLIG